MLQLVGKEKGFYAASIVLLRYTAVSTKVVPQQHKSAHDNADWYYG